MTDFSPGGAALVSLFHGHTFPDTADIRQAAHFHTDCDLQPKQPGLRVHVGAGLPASLPLMEVVELKLENSPSADVCQARKESIKTFLDPEIPLPSFSPIFPPFLSLSVHAPPLPPFSVSLFLG